MWLRVGTRCPPFPSFPKLIVYSLDKLGFTPNICRPLAKVWGSPDLSGLDAHYK